MNSMVDIDQVSVGGPPQTWVGWPEPSAGTSRGGFQCSYFILVPADSGSNWFC
jgi:hypothetical protein